MRDIVYGFRYNIVVDVSVVVLGVSIPLDFVLRDLWVRGVPTPTSFYGVRTENGLVSLGIILSVGGRRVNFPWSNTPEIFKKDNPGLETVYIRTVIIVYIYV